MFDEKNKIFPNLICDFSIVLVPNDGGGIFHLFLWNSAVGVECLQARNGKLVDVTKIVCLEFLDYYTLPFFGSENRCKWQPNNSKNLRTLTGNWNFKSISWFGHDTEELTINNYHCPEMYKYRGKIPEIDKIVYVA